MSKSGPETAAITARYRDFAGEARGPVPLPGRVPDVAWRAGLDLNPLDVTSADDVRWLQCLLWPGETGRQERLAADSEEGHFTLAENGTRAIAHTDPHGTWLRWLP